MTESIFRMLEESVFDYAEMTPIHEEGYAFRLIRLLGGREPQISCELFKAYLHTEQAMPYEALSYVWGDGATSEPIRLNGKAYFVKPNLHQALQSLRLENEDRVLWIDAICINQKEHKEKNHQLLHMASIYREADRVIFWLGPSTYEIDLLMSALGSLHRHACKTVHRDWAPDDKRWIDLWSILVPDHQYYLEYWRGLKALFDRPWFRRVWILQECAHAKTGIFACGRKTVPSRIFGLAPLLLGLDPDPHCQSVLEILPGSPRQGWWREHRDLYTLLRKFHNSKASDPRDHIYALLSMATDVEVMGFPNVDYSLSIREVLEQTVTFLFPYVRKQKLPDYETFPALIRDLEKLNNLAIVQAAEDGQDVLLHRLTSHGGVEPNFFDALGRAALLCAATQGHVGIVAHLLTLRGINANIRDSRKRTPLFRAVEKHHLPVINLLISTPGVDVYLADFFLTHHYA